MCTCSAGYKRWAILQKMGLEFTPWIKWWNRRTLTAYSHCTNISSSHLQLELLSRHVMVLQGCSVIEHWLCAGPHLSSMSAFPPLMLLIGVNALPVVNAVMRSLKSTARPRAVQIWTIKIGFDPATDSIWIRSIQIAFDPNSVLELVRTLLRNDFGYVT